MSDVTLQTLWHQLEAASRVLAEHERCHPSKPQTATVESVDPEWARLFDLVGSLEDQIARTPAEGQAGHVIKARALAVAYVESPLDDYRGTPVDAILVAMIGVDWRAQIQRMVPHVTAPASIGIAA